MYAVSGRSEGNTQYYKLENLSIFSIIRIIVFSHIYQGEHVPKNHPFRHTTREGEYARYREYVPDDTGASSTGYECTIFCR